MKRLLTSLFVLAAPAFVWSATGPNVVLNSSVTYAVTPSVNLNQFAPPNSPAKNLSSQITFSSIAFNTNTFYDGQQSTGSLTVVSTGGVVAAYATDQITVSANSVIRSSAASVNLVVASTNGLSSQATDTLIAKSTSGLAGFATDTIYVASTNTLSGAQIFLNGMTIANNGWRVDVTSDTAADIATQINAGFTIVTATAGVNTSSVTITAVSTGTAGNLFTLATTPSNSLTVASPYFTGGYTGYVSVNGIIFPGTNWNLVSTTTLATSILGQVGTNVPGVTVSTPTNAYTITFTAVSSGTAGNNYTLVTSSASALAAGSANFTGGSQATITVAGTTILNNGWRIDVASDTAADIVAQVNAAQYIVTSSTPIGTSTVTFVVKATGTSGNSYTLSTSTPTALVASSGTFTGGQNDPFIGQYITFNGQNYQHNLAWDAHYINVPGATSGDGNLATSTAAAISITALLNSFGVIQATCAAGTGSVVYATATVAGTAGNAFTLSYSGTTGMTVSSPTFAGGNNNATITINGVTLTNGTSWPTPLVASTTANLASGIAAAINANSSLSAIITAQAVGSVITSTSVGTGLVNYTTVSSTPAALAFANATMTGGATSSFLLNSGILNLVNHGFAPCLPVLYATATASVGGLVNGTTYYPIIVDANDVELSTTSALCQAGTFVTITSTNTQLIKHTYTLTPLAYTQGPASALWQVSNDGVNWANFTTTAANVAVSSQTFTVSGSSTVVQDFGQVDYGYMRYKVTPPTQGALAVEAVLNAKD